MRLPRVRLHPDNLAAYTPWSQCAGPPDKLHCGRSILTPLTLRTVRSATIEINGQQLTLEPKIPEDAKTLLRAIGVTNPSG